MKLSTLGIGLLTVMVAINSYLNESYFTKEDGSFKNGIIIERSEIIATIIADSREKTESRLYAFNSVRTVDLTNWVNFVELSKLDNNNQQPKIEEPISVEQVNSLVVYDLNNPEKNIITTKYEDFVDDIPLDNTNTIVSGFMQIMPRK